MFKVANEDLFGKSIYVYSCTQALEWVQRKNPLGKLASVTKRSSHQNRN